MLVAVLRADARPVNVGARIGNHVLLAGCHAGSSAGTGGHSLQRGGAGCRYRHTDSKRRHAWSRSLNAAVALTPVEQILIGYLQGG